MDANVLTPLFIGGFIMQTVDQGTLVQRHEMAWLYHSWVGDLDLGENQKSILQQILQIKHGVNTPFLRLVEVAGVLGKLISPLGGKFHMHPCTLTFARHETSPAL